MASTPQRCAVHWSDEHDAFLAESADAPDVTYTASNPNDALDGLRLLLSTRSADA